MHETRSINDSNGFISRIRDLHGMGGGAGAGVAGEELGMILLLVRTVYDEDIFEF